MATVKALHVSATHTFSKAGVDRIRLLAGIGIEGDAHAGETVKHRSRVAQDPTQPNLRQVHLLESERLEELDVPPGDLGENITTMDIDLHALSAGTRLRFGEAEIELTGLRNPCNQIENYREGLLGKVAWKDEEGNIVRRGGVMAIVLTSGEIREGDAIKVTPPETFTAMERV